jgi:hypothetical protein
MKVLLCMIYLHLIDDYVLQGWLASAKSKSWWQKNCPDKLYKKDYIIALFEHGFMNSFLIHIPIYLWLYNNEFVLTISILCATFYHAYIDNKKANKRKLNLIKDQLLHIFFIFMIWLIYWSMWK